MKVLDLFSGLGGWSEAFRQRGHNITTVDIEPKFKPTICQDIFDISGEYMNVTYGHFDVILASPPCECFSVASIGKHWNFHDGIYAPKDVKTREALRLVYKTLGLIIELKPKFWVMENPRGMLRKVVIMPKATICFCKYGETRMKPTDLWGNIPSSFIPLTCYNGAPDHERAPRGAWTGTQGIKSRAERAKVPFGLSLAMCIACEKSL